MTGCGPRHSTAMPGILEPEAPETLADGHAPRLPQLLPDAAKKPGRMQALTMDCPDVQKYLEMCTIPGVTPFGMPDPEDA